jgi:hypothetical protein
MAVTNTQHLLVYQRAREHWGDETAEALMEMLPPAGLDVATKQDVAQVRIDLGKDIAQVRTDLRKDISAACSELRSHTWKVTVGTGIGLYLLLIGTLAVLPIVG